MVFFDWSNSQLASFFTIFLIRILGVRKPSFGFGGFSLCISSLSMLHYYAYSHTEKINK